MTNQDDFKEGLLRRIDAYRTSETKLQQRLRDVNKELETIRGRREAAERLYEVEFGASPEKLVGGAPPGWTKADVPPRARSELREQAPPGPLTGLGWEEAIVRVLGDNGPLHVTEIWSRLSAAGFRTNAGDPLRSITATASRSRRLVKAGPRTYGLIQMEGGGNE